MVQGSCGQGKSYTDVNTTHPAHPPACCRYEARAVARNPAAFTKIAPLTYRPPRIAAAIARECADVLFQVCVSVREQQKAIVPCRAYKCTSRKLPLQSRSRLQQAGPYSCSAQMAQQT